MDPDRDNFRDDHGPRRFGGRRWFARLAFSFIVLGAVAAYEGNRARERGESTRATLLFAGAAVGVAAGLAGVRARHRP